MNKKTIGSILWIMSIQYFIVQILVASAFIGHFSWSENTISDLGNASCAVYSSRYVCSPLYWLMNASFIVMGITQLLGSLLLYLSYKTRKNLLGYGLLMLAGAGTVLVGMFPENTIGTLHTFGAALPFALGNAAMLIVAKNSGLPIWLKHYSYVCGLLALAALVLFISKIYLGIGLGGMERVVAYPQTIWMIVLGGYFLMNHKRIR